MKSNSYWENRANARLNSYHKNTDSTVRKINKAYDDAIEYIDSEIKKIFDKFSIDGKLSSMEARDILNSKITKKEMELLKAQIKSVQDEDLRRYLLSRLNAPAYKARMTRLEALKENVYINLKKVSEVENKLSESAYIDTINNAYYRTTYDIQKGVGMGFDVSNMSIDNIEKILTEKWSGKNYSQRIWGNTDVLAGKLEEVITQGFLTGKSLNKISKEIQELSDVGKFAAERLIRTETTYIANAAEIESYKECGIDKYVFLATLDLRTSNMCREHDGKVYDVDKAIPGENLPPLHPHCRSTTIAYFDDEALKSMKRRARDPETGKPYVLPANMTYKEWHQKYVVEKYGEQNTKTLEKMIKNKSSDRKQYDRYKKVLGKDVPKSFTAFRELKYNDSDGWSALKSDYRYKNMWNKRTIINQDNNNRSLPLEGTPNTITDLATNGNVKQRRIYGEDGKVIIDIDTSDHNKSKYHPMGAHKHEYDYNNNIPRGKAQGFTDDELRQNKDIIKEGENYHGN